MSEIKLFDTWTFQEEVPEPFHQLLKKEGLRKTTTTLEWLSQYIEKQEGTIESLFFDWRMNNPASVSMLSGLRKPQIRF